MRHVSPKEEEAPANLDQDFRAFFAREYPRLVRALFLLTGDGATAEDLAQEALARVFERWERVQGMDSPTGYVFRVAANLERRRVRQRLRAGRRTPQVAERPDHENRAISGADLHRALMSLPLRSREALVMREWLDLDDQKMAGLLGIEPSSVRSRLHRARKALIDLMGEGYG